MFLNLVKSDTVKMCKVKADAHDTMYQIQSNAHLHEIPY